MASEGAVQRVLVPAYAKQLSPVTQLAIQRATSETGPENGTKLPPPRPEDMLSAAAALEGPSEESGPGGTGELRQSLGFTASPCRTVLITGGLCSDGDLIDFSLMPSLTLYRSECYFSVVFL